MRKSEFADLLVTEGVYSTRTAAMAAIDAGKVKMQNVEFEDIEHVFPVLDAYVRLQEDGKINRHQEMEKKGYIGITARQVALMDEDVWPAITRRFTLDISGHCRIYIYVHGSTVVCDKTDKSAYKSLMPGQWVKDTVGRWRQCWRAEDRPAEGCVVFYDFDDKIVHKLMPDAEVFI